MVPSLLQATGPVLVPDFLPAYLMKEGGESGPRPDSVAEDAALLKFIDERFKPAVLVQEQNVKAYYEGHLAELKKQYPADNSLTTLAPKIEDLLQGQQVDQEFDAWLDEQRKEKRVDARGRMDHRGKARFGHQREESQKRKIG